MAECVICRGELIVLRAVADGWLTQCDGCHVEQTITDEELEGAYETGTSVSDRRV